MAYLNVLKVNFFDENRLLNRIYSEKSSSGFDESPNDTIVSQQHAKKILSDLNKFCSGPLPAPICERVASWARKIANRMICF